MNNCNHRSPARWTLKRFPRPLGQGGKLDESISVARVRPRTSKGITAMCTVVYLMCCIQSVPTTSCASSNWLYSQDSVSRGLARTLRVTFMDSHRFACVATDRRSTLSRHRIGVHSCECRRPLYQLVLPVIEQLCLYLMYHVSLLLLATPIWCWRRLLPHAFISTLDVI